MRTLLVAAAVLLLPASALAVNVEPGSVWVFGGIGPGFKYGTPLGASTAYFLLDAGGEYNINTELSVVGNINLGLSGTIPLRGRLGVRYRLTNLELPVLPYVQAQASVGGLFDVINTNLVTVGAFLAAGADYMLTAKLAAGGQVGIELGGTTGDHAAYWGTIDVLVTVSYAVF